MSDNKSNQSKWIQTPCIIPSCNEDAEHDIIHLYIEIEYLGRVSRQCKASFGSLSDIGIKVDFISSIYDPRNALKPIINHFSPFYCTGNIYCNQTYEELNKSFAGWGRVIC